MRRKDAIQRDILSVHGLSYRPTVTHWHKHQCRDLLKRLFIYPRREEVQIIYSHIALSLPFSPAPSVQIGDDLYPPQSAQNQASHGKSNFVDCFGPIFSIYSIMATEEDNKMAIGRWKADADGIITIVRHYILILCFIYANSSIIDWANVSRP